MRADCRALSLPLRCASSHATRTRDVASARLRGARRGCKAAVSTQAD